jgi:hypothetical protein
MNEAPLLTTPAELQEHIAEVRKKIAHDQQLHEEYKAVFWPWYPAEYEAVKAALAARSRWYNGEILRAKHNLARYIRGEKLKQTLWLWVTVVEGLDNAIVDLNNAVVEFEQVGEKPSNQELWNQIAKSNLEMALHSINSDRETLERTMYGG